jgi:LemA protein
METEKLLDRLYPNLAKRRRRKVLLAKAALRLRGWSRYLIAGGVITVLWVVAHLYYYNKLVDLEFNVQEAWAQVEAQWQRRYHIQQNLTRMVIEYARHERELLVRLTTMRMKKEDRDAAARGATRTQQAGQPGAGAAKPDARSLRALRAELEKLDPKQLNELFPQIQVVAEQYPALRLTENFQQFSKAVVDTENAIVLHVETYNKAVNVYTTVLNQFPAMVFGRLCGFREYDFYRPGRKTLAFRPVEAKIDG